MNNKIFVLLGKKIIMTYYDYKVDDNEKTNIIYKKIKTKIIKLH